MTYTGKTMFSGSLNQLQPATACIHIKLVPNTQQPLNHSINYLHYTYIPGERSYFPPTNILWNLDIKHTDLLKRGQWSLKSH